MNIRFPITNVFRSAYTDLRKRPAGNMPSLDVLRSAAILLVISAHVGGFFSARIQALPFVFYGWSGVDLFFVLSGLLIGGQLWKELSKRGAIDIRRFVLRRGFRIWPLYYSFILVLGGLALFKGESVRGFLVDICCVSNYYHHRVAGGWSLSTEEQFYVLAPVLLYLGSRVIAPQALVALPAAWLLLLPVLRWRIVRNVPLSRIPEMRYYFPFHTHSDGLAAGLILAWIGVMRPSWMTINRGKALGITVIGIGLAFVLRHLSQGVFRFSSLAALFGSVTYFLLTFRPLPRVLQWQGFYVMSRLSYGMYLNHFHLLDFTAALALRAGKGSIGFILCWVVSVMASMLASFATFAIVELPFLRMRERRLGHARR
ncbi:MAG TPA: acyltransferase [Elusimicrobiota bacterium]|nr:acyltransferase [Elusimicrobiota bacterium]